MFYVPNTHLLSLISYATSRRKIPFQQCLFLDPPFYAVVLSALFFLRRQIFLSQFPSLMLPFSPSILLLLLRFPFYNPFYFLYLRRIFPCSCFKFFLRKVFVLLSRLLRRNVSPRDSSQVLFHIPSDSSFFSDVLFAAIPSFRIRSVR